MLSVIPGGVAFIAAVLLSSALTWLAVRWSVGLRLVATPRSDRWHVKTTPNTGGAAITIAAACCYLGFASAYYRPIALAAAFVALLGFLDDRVQLRPSIKFAGQALAATAVIAGGVVFHATPWLWSDLIISFVWISGITNAFNLIDNMDGLCAGVAVIICGSRYVLAIQDNDTGGALLLAILAGSTVGFLVFNHNPARIFMGDCGSMFLGFTLGALSIASPVPNTRIFASTLLGPALAFLYPIFDVILVSVLRRGAGRPISQGGRDHSSHRLVSLGLTERKVVWMLWLLAALGATAGTLTWFMPIGVFVVAILLITGAGVLGIFLAALPGYALPERAPIRAHWIRRATPNLRAAVTLIVDVLLSGVALLAAFLIRWEKAFLGPPLHQFATSLPISMMLFAVGSISFRTFNSGWRWFSAGDLFALVRCTLFSSTVSLFVVWFLGMRDYSRGVIILYSVFALTFTAGLRLSMRLLWQSLVLPARARRAAILGVNDSTALAILVLQRSNAINVTPVAIIDPDPSADRLRVHGVSVYYSGEDAAGLLRRKQVDVLVVPSGEVLTEENRTILEECREAGVSVELLEVEMKRWDQSVKAAASGV